MRWSCENIWQCFPTDFFHIFILKIPLVRFKHLFIDTKPNSFLVGNHWYVCSCMRDRRVDIQTRPGRFMAVPTLYFWFSKEIVDSSPTSFFLFSPTKSAATCAGRTFSRRRRFRFSHNSTSSLSARFLFFNRKSWRQQYSFWEEERIGHGSGVWICSMTQMDVVWDLYLAGYEQHSEEKECDVYAAHVLWVLHKSYFGE